MRKCLQAVLLMVVFAGTARAQVQDTIGRKTPLFVGKDALLLGAFTLGTAAVAPVDRHFAAVLQNPAAQENRFLRSGATGFRRLGLPGSLAVGAGLYLIGRVDRQRRLQDLGLHSVEAMVLAGAVTVGVKALAGRARPYLDVTNPYSFQLGRGFSAEDYRSFPSGHTSTAFALASTVSRETQMWWPRSRWYIGSVAYGGAALVGISRMYNNAHWASDVMAGAAIGTILGLKVVRYNHSHPDNRIDKALLKGSHQMPPVLVSFKF